jgi:formylglycine-generating enzyme required for sulfatase activity
MQSGPPDGMAQIMGGTFRMGSDVAYPEERPAHSVTIDGFWIDRHAVTNAEFRGVRRRHRLRDVRRARGKAWRFPGRRESRIPAASDHSFTT